MVTEKLHIVFAEAHEHTATLNMCRHLAGEGITAVCFAAGENGEALAARWITCAEALAQLLR